jgi:uncharacterized membrane protein
MSQNDMRGTHRAGPAVPGRSTATIGGERGLRPNSLAAVIMLLIQYSLGIWVSLYATIPKSDQGKGIFAAFGAAVADGPVALALHALLGTLLLVTAITLIIRAVLARKAVTTAIGAVAFLAIVAAWLSGARFTGDGADRTSFAMALATAVALLCYVIILFVPRLTQGAGR